MASEYRESGPPVTEPQHGTPAADTMTPALAFTLEVSRAVAAREPPARILERIVRGGRRLLDCERLAITGADGRRQQLTLRAVDPAPAEVASLVGRSFPLAGTSIGRAMRDPRPLFVNSDKALLGDPFAHALMHGARLANAAVAPVFSGTAATGGVLAVNRAGGFTNAELPVLDLIAGLAALVPAQASRDAPEAPEPATRALPPEADDDYGDPDPLESRWLATLGELAAGVAHDLNNALNPVVAFAELIRAQADQPERVRLYAERILLAAKDGAETVRRIQRFTRRRKEEREKRPIALLAVVREAIDLTRPVAAERRDAAVRFEESVDSSLVVEANAVELREVLLNLISNCLDAMPDGGVIRVVGRAAGERAVLAVQDTGTGMATGVARRALEPFFTTKGARGTGLGLSQAYGLIRAHGGDLSIESWPDVGTTVQLRLPRVRREEMPVAAIGRRPLSRHASPLRILLVDDNVLSLEATAAALRAAGHVVVTAPSGESALELFEPGRYRLVLTDLGMPGLNGFELLDRLRSADPKVRLGVITGWSIPEGDENLRRRGIELVFVKPIDPDQLLAAL